MKQNDSAKCVRVWPAPMEEFEVIFDESWLSGGTFLGQEIVAASFWESPERLFLHTHDTTWRIEPLKDEG